MDAYVVDAFTDVAFRGNPAGVVVLDAPAEEGWMRSVAAEFKHAETAFVVVGGPDDQPKPLRWFTPTTEVDLCGHATLATAHVLGGDQRFSTRSGVLTCSATDDGWIEMDFPLDPVDPVEPPAELAAALPGTAPRAVAKGAEKLLVEFGSAAEVRAVEPDFDALLRVPAASVIVTAEAGEDGLDFVSRMFAPRMGIPEDPVTGSAHCTLAAWWSPKLGATDLVGKQVSERSGTVRMALRGDRVALRGRAVTVLRGDLLA